MSDLSTLFQYAPTTAAGFMGLNQRNAEKEAELKQQELAQLIQDRMAKAQRDSQLHPLDLERQRLLNQTAQAQLPGIEATSSLNQLKAKGAGETYDSDIAATKAKNQNVVDDAAHEQYTRARDVFLQAGPMLQSTPGPMRARAFKDMLEGSGMKLDNPFVQKLLSVAQSNPDGFPNVVNMAAQKLGDQATAMNPAARASMYNADQHRAASKYSADSSAAASRYGADRRAETKGRSEAAGETIQDVFKALKTGKMTPEKAMVVISAGKLTAKSDEEKALYDQAGQMIEQFVYNKAGASKEGQMQLSPEGKLTPKTTSPVFGDDKPKRGTGTRDDPIVLK